MTNIIIIAGIILGILLLFGYFYNQLASRQNQIENSISSLDALFIKRSDLIPNLIEVVQQYMQFEDKTLEKITALRSINSQSNPAVEQEAKTAMKSLMVQVENYPDLKANDQFTDLQYSMNEVEEQISAGRRYVSSTITYYNDAVRLFPSNIIANIFGFKKHEWQYATTNQRESVTAKDLFNKK